MADLTKRGYHAAAAVKQGRPARGRPACDVARPPAVIRTGQPRAKAGPGHGRPEPVSPGTVSRSAVVDCAGGAEHRHRGPHLLPVSRAGQACARQAAADMTVGRGHGGCPGRDEVERSQPAARAGANATVGRGTAVRRGTAAPGRDGIERGRSRGRGRQPLARRSIGVRRSPRTRRDRARAATTQRSVTAQRACRAGAAVGPSAIGRAERHGHDHPRAVGARVPGRAKGTVNRGRDGRRRNRTPADRSAATCR